MSEKFKNKVVAITGGAGLLCSSMAAALAGKGAKVAILDLKEENAQKVAAEINQSGGEAIGIVANVLDMESLKQARDIVVTHFWTMRYFN